MVCSALVCCVRGVGEGCNGSMCSLSKVYTVYFCVSVAWKLILGYGGYQRLCHGDIVILGFTLLCCVVGMSTLLTSC